MKTNKLILFQIIIFVTLGMIISRYGISFENFWNYFTFFNEQIILLLSLILVSMLTIAGYMQTRVLRKKNSLKVSLIILTISTLFFVYRTIKIQEPFEVYLLIGYLILTITTLFMLKELHKIVKKVFLKKHSD